MNAYSEIRNTSEPNCRISVCIATYQGERFIAAQLRSILEQLCECDEVVVVDDHSRDRTCEQVRALADPRVRLVTHTRNVGVVESFEEAILQASGKLIFLSDQDDLWAPEKVSRVVEVFDNNADVTLVTTDAALIDESGAPLAGSYYATRGKFRAGLIANLVRCKYLGCTMAFRSELVPKIVPFPHGTEILHDIWIGAVNSMCFGNTRYLHEPLVWYRRHSNALTRGKLSPRRQVRARLQLLSAILAFWSRNLFARLMGT
jgi:glycosyltransferase involved in cell wall biosynthesis